MPDSDIDVIEREQFLKERANSLQHAPFLTEKASWTHNRLATGRTLEKALTHISRGVAKDVLLVVNQCPMRDIAVVLKTQPKLAPLGVARKFE